MHRYARRYGTWDASVPTGLSSFINALSGTAWMQINAAYTDSKGGRGTAFMHYGGTCYDTGTKGASLSDADVLVRCSPDARAQSAVACAGTILCASPTSAP